MELEGGKRVDLSRGHGGVESVLGGEDSWG